MAFDKAKVLRAAEKYLAQGKIPAAIKEYRDLVQHDPADLNTLNILGDLYVRTNQKERAVECFKHIAGHYRDQGFGNKAIAMFKIALPSRRGPFDLLRISWGRCTRRSFGSLC